MNTRKVRDAVLCWGVVLFFVLLALTQPWTGGGGVDPVNIDGAPSGCQDC